MNEDQPPRALVWLRDDLRLDDHEPLREAIDAADGRVIVLWCDDPRPRAEDPLTGLPRTGAHRARFLIECLADLRARLRERGGELVIRAGRPEAVIPELCARWGVQDVYAHDEAAWEERRAQERVARALARAGRRLHLRWGATLIHLDDLPFDVEALPEVFTHFRKQVERASDIRAPKPAPDRLAPLPEGIDPGALPSLDAWGLPAPEDDPRATLRFVGGESAAIERLETYVWRHDRLRLYKQTRNGLIGPDYSSKLAAWLARGCLSPRRVWLEVKRYERERVANDSTYWLIFELLWRDYFRFLALQQGAQLFQVEGIKHARYTWHTSRRTFERWWDGTTGIPFIDANMRELRQTGFMSNRGRQNVGSFLARDLRLDWRMGAAAFESALVDYDACSNWGNWQYVSGVGNDPRDRTFNILAQAERYDPHGAYVKRWLPELEPLPEGIVHRHFEDDPRALRERYGFDASQQPRPLVRWPASRRR